MKNEEFYGSAYEIMKKTEAGLLDLVTFYSTAKREKEGIKPIVYVCSRIKTADSMLKKLKARGFEQTLYAALNDVYDSVGIRVGLRFRRRCVPFCTLAENAGERTDRKGKGLLRISEAQRLSQLSSFNNNDRRRNKRLSR